MLRLPSRTTRRARERIRVFTWSPPRQCARVRVYEALTVVATVVRERLNAPRSSSRLRASAALFL